MAVSLLLPAIARQCVKISAIIKNSTIYEIRSVIRFINAIGRNAVEIQLQLCETHRRTAMSYRKLYKWTLGVENGHKWSQMVTNIPEFQTYKWVLTPIVVTKGKTNSFPMSSLVMKHKFRTSMLRQNNKVRKWKSQFKTGLNRRRQKVWGSMFRDIKNIWDNMMST